MREDNTTEVKHMRVMTRHQRRHFVWMLIVGTSLSIGFALVWFYPNHIPHNFKGNYHIFDFILFIAASYVVWHQILMEWFLWFVSLTMKRPRYIRPQKGLKVAFITNFVPSKEPIELLEKTLPAMVKTKYPHDTWLLDEGDSNEAKELCKKLGVKYFSRKNIEKYNTKKGMFTTKTKAGNHNAWYDMHGSSYEVVAQIDTDFIPKSNFLTRTLGYFRDQRVAFVGTPQIYGNVDDSFVARGAAEQSYSFYGPTMKGLFGQDMTLMIGANHIVRVSALKELGYYKTHLTEDLLTGMSFHSKRYISVYVPEVLAIGEGPSTWSGYFNQQMRWAYGCMDIFLRHSIRLLPKMRKKHSIRYFYLEQHYFNGLALMMAIILITLYFLFGYASSAINVSLMIVWYIPLIIWQMVIAIYLQRFNISPNKEKGLLIRGKLVSVAAWPVYFLAFLGVITRRKMKYKVTPKGNLQEQKISASLFLPHLLLGTITAVDLIIGFRLKHIAAFLVFWASINTLIMYFFVVTAYTPLFVELSKKIKVSRYSEKSIEENINS